MANLDDRVPENVPGTYYVDSECIDCGLCQELAPENFAQSEDHGYAFVCKQPANDEQRNECEEALEQCPVEAIGNDGE